MELNQLRPDLRGPDQLRPLAWQLDVAPAAQGSVLVKLGNTQVLCAVSVEDRLPRWMAQQNVTGGWLTAEYSLMPYSTAPRSSRESSSGKVGGRTHEIQRLIGRALRAVVDLQAFGRRTIWVDCDVLQADGGTRTAAVTGSYVALQRAVERLMTEGLLKKNPIREALAAVSVGIVEGQPRLDLCYSEDSAAAVDMNVVMTSSGKIVEVQGTAETTPFTPAEMASMMKLAEKGIRELFTAQRQALSPAGTPR